MLTFLAFEIRAILCMYVWKMTFVYSKCDKVVLPQFFHSLFHPPHLSNLSELLKPSIVRISIWLDKKIFIDFTTIISLQTNWSFCSDQSRRQIFSLDRTFLLFQQWLLTPTKAKVRPEVEVEVEEEVEDQEVVDGELKMNLRLNTLPLISKITIYVANGMSGTEGYCKNGPHSRLLTYLNLEWRSL